MQTVNPQLLTDGQLEYAFFESCGMEIFGTSGGPFVMRNTTNNSLMMLRANDENIEHVILSDAMTLFPFEVALKYSASFSVKDGVVTCLIGDAICTGLSYSQAAMRAVVVFNRIKERKK